MSKKKVLGFVIDSVKSVEIDRSIGRSVEEIGIKKNVVKRILTREEIFKKAGVSSNDMAVFKYIDSSNCFDVEEVEKRLTK